MSDDRAIEVLAEALRGNVWHAVIRADLAEAQVEALAGAGFQITDLTSPLPAAGLSEEALEAAERATATAEKLIDAIERVSGHLNNEGLADKAKINKARTVIAGLDQ